LTGATARRLRFVDSHTGGEPTRVVVEGGPDLGSGPLAERRRVFDANHSRYRKAVVDEPRASPVMVGALLLEPHLPGAEAGVLFFGNEATLGMCGHGTMGLVVTLAHLGRLAVGEHLIDTPVGPVRTELAADGSVRVDNIPSYRQHAGVVVEVPGHGKVRGDVAWGGNWFFLIEDHGLGLSLGNVAALTAFCDSVRVALFRAGIRGAGGAEVDHVELFGPSPTPGLDSRNFVLCPGGAYDRSPCGTGTSAKLACLHAEGKLGPGERWRQESIVGSVFEAQYALHPDGAGRVLPRLTGTAHVTAEGTLWLDERDPYCWGLGG
jgi:4-hydroxyproline epimerase